MADRLDAPLRAGHDADLIEYVLITVPSAEELGRVVPTLIGLVASDAIRLLDVVVLLRPHGQAGVTVREAEDLEDLSPLAAVIEQDAYFSLHDVELAAAILEPDVAALLLLVEDRWASLLAAAARQAGGRLCGGERVVRHRFSSAVAAVDAPTQVVSLRSGHGGLLTRTPASVDAEPTELAVDQAAQLRVLATLVEDGVISLDQYEVQRRRALLG